MRLDFIGTHFSNIAFGAIAAFVLVGCGNGQSVDTLDGLTTSSGFDGSYRKPINLNYPSQTRFLASNGLLPMNGPGDTCLASGFRPASGIICFSPSGKTEVSVRRFKFSGTYDDLKKVRDRLQKLQVNIIELAALDASTPQEEETPQEKADIASRTKELKAEVEQVGGELAANNFFIFRWKAADQAGGGGTVGSTLSSRAGTQQEESGLVIVGGVTVASLRLGLEDAGEDLKDYPKATKIATYTMGAENLLYFSSASLSAALKAKLDGSLEDIQDISPSTKAVIDAYASLGRAYETQGAFSATSVESLPLSDYNEKYGSQHVFYSTMTDVETLLGSLRK
ncbi:hypothetical protein ACROSR_16165 [Roseovarius tibetensis]|uniref:hypothetical protein n=1 Tax=Roseovarius tibetensis TaxID=2685897 RepID=UPI003D7F2D62